MIKSGMFSQACVGPDLRPYIQSSIGAGSASQRYSFQRSSISKLGGEKQKLTENQKSALGIAHKLRDFEDKLENSYNRERREYLINKYKSAGTAPSDTASANPYIIIANDLTSTRIRSNFNKMATTPTTTTTTTASNSEDYKPLVSSSVPYLSRFFLDKGPNINSTLSSSPKNNKGKSTTTTATTVASTRTPPISSSFPQGANPFGPFPKQVTKKKQRSPCMKHKLPQSRVSHQQQHRPSLLNSMAAITGVPAQSTPQGIVPLSPQRYVMFRPFYLTQKTPSAKLKSKLSKSGSGSIKSSTQQLGLGLGIESAPIQIHDQLPGLPVKKRPKLIQLSRSGRLNICTPTSFINLETPILKTNFPGPSSGSGSQRLTPEKMEKLDTGLQNTLDINAVVQSQSITTSTTLTAAAATSKVIANENESLPMPPIPALVPKKVEVGVEGVPVVNSMSTVSTTDTTATNSSVSVWNLENDPRPSFDDFTMKNFTPEISDYTDLESESIQRIHEGKEFVRIQDIPLTAPDNNETDNTDSEVVIPGIQNNCSKTRIKSKVRKRERHLQRQPKLKNLNTPLALVKSGVFAYLQSKRAATAAACIEGHGNRVDEQNDRSPYTRTNYKSKHSYPHSSANPRKVVSNPSLHPIHRQLPPPSATPVLSQLKLNSKSNKKSKKRTKRFDKSSSEITETQTETTVPSTTTMTSNTNTTTTDLEPVTTAEADTELCQPIDPGPILSDTVTISLESSSVPAPVKQLKGILKRTKHQNSDDSNSNPTRSRTRTRGHNNKPKIKMIKDKDTNNNGSNKGSSALASLGICTAQPGTHEWMEYWEKYDEALAAYKQSEVIYLRENKEYQQDIDKYTREAARLALEQAMFRQSIGLDPKSGQEIIEKPIKGLTTLNGFVFDRHADGPSAFLSSFGKKGFRLDVDVRGLDPDKIRIETEFNLMKVQVPMKDAKSQKNVVKSIVIGVPSDFNLGDLEIYPIVNGWLVVEAPDTDKKLQII